jgi:hypothetical protein
MASKYNRLFRPFVGLVKKNPIPSVKNGLSKKSTAYKGCM